MSSLAQYMNSGAGVSVDGITDGPLYNKSQPIIDTGNALYGAMTFSQAVRATTREMRANWYKRARKYMYFDQHSQKSTTTTVGLNYPAFMYSNELFMLRVAQYSVQHSSDGVNWAHCEFDSPTSNQQLSFGNNATRIGRVGNTFFMVGFIDSQMVRVFKSTDGLRWTVAMDYTVPQSWTFNSFNSANDRLFLTFTNGGLFPRVMSSVDGVSWLESVPLANNVVGIGYVSPIAWNGTVYCLVANSGDTNANKSYYSTDGLTWTLGTTAFSKFYTSGGTTNDVFVYNNKFHFAFYNSSGGSMQIWQSSDGNNWTMVYAGGGSQMINGFIASSSLLMIYGNSSYIMTSPDGVTWTVQNFGVAGQSISTGVWDGTRFVLNSANGSVCRQSTDGVTWSAGTTISNQLTNYFRGDGAVVFNGNMYVFTSYSVTRLVGNTANVCINSAMPIAGYNNVKMLAKNGNTLVYVGSTGLYTINLSTLDHKTSQTLAGTYYAVCYGNGKWVASGNGFIAYSTDGYNWTSVAVAGIHMNVAYGGGMFVTIRPNSTVSFSSPDGINWTQRVLPLTIGTDIVLQYASGFWMMHQPGSATTLGSRDGINWLTGSNIISTGVVKLTVINDKHVFAPRGFGQTSWVATGPNQASQWWTDSANNWAVFAYNSKLDQYVGYSFGTSGTSNDQAAYKTSGMFARNSWSYGATGSTLSTTPYGTYWYNGTSSYNLNPNNYGQFFTQIPDTATMIAVSGSSQLAFVDGGFANVSASIQMSYSLQEFNLWYSGSRNCELSPTWTDDGSLYCVTGGSGNPMISRLQLGVLYTNPHYNNGGGQIYGSNQLLQYRRLG